MPQTNQVHRKTWLILAALILRALIPLAIRQSEKADKDQPKPTSKRTSPTSSPRTKTSSHHRQQRGSNQDLPTSHSTEDLSSFIFPTTDLSQVTLEEAMNSLLARYRNICREPTEGPVNSYYTIQGQPDPIFYLKLGGDFISNCEFIAAMAGMNLEIEDDQLIFAEVEDGPPVQRRWTVPPTFPSFLPDLTELGIPIDPFEDPFNSRPEIRELFLGLGVIKENDPVSFLTSSS